MSNVKKKRVAIIGAGLGGISAALSLASEGFEVTLFEKNQHLGGKLNVLKKEGFSFDLGPSILTLPHYFRALFAKCGEDFDTHVKLVRVAPHWRNFFPDGLIVDLYQEEAAMRRELDKLPGGSAQLWPHLQRFLQYAKQQYDLVESGYFAKGLDNIIDFWRFYGWFRLFFKMDHRRRMATTIEQMLPESHLQQIFEYFIKYVGSSAYNAPGFMNLMPHIQFEYDLWYVDGGLYRLAEALQRLLQKMQVTVHLGVEIQQILRDGARVTGIELTNGERFMSDYVVSNMEVIPTYERLLNETTPFMNKLQKFEPACSGLVLHLGVNKIYEQLAHHNFFFSADQKKHFSTVFDEKRLPEDPTIYLVAPTRSDKTQAPAGHDNLKILPHIPYINETHPYTAEDYRQFKERVIDKLEAMGLTQLRKHTVLEDYWTPLDIQKRYYSNKGSIYGVVSDWKKNYGFKAPKQCSKYQNLFFVGGSVNPGGGMPMVILCGQKVSEKLVAYDREMGGRALHA